MYPSNAIKNRLGNISWFAHCGESPQVILADYDLYYFDRGQMIRSHASLKWIRALNQAGNRISDEVVRKHYDRVSGEWNRVAELAGTYFDKVFLDMFEGFRETFGVSEGFVIWNRVAIIEIIILDHYRHFELDTKFPETVLACYEAGRYPCGWDGDEWPDGRMCVW
jgi:hypothetical protein